MQSDGVWEVGYRGDEFVRHILLNVVDLCTVAF